MQVMLRLKSTVTVTTCHAKYFKFVYYRWDILEPWNCKARGSTSHRLFFLNPKPQSRLVHISM